MEEKAKELVVKYFNEHMEKTDNTKITVDNVFVEWFCRIQHNWKALLRTNIYDGMCYAVTYNGDTKKFYIDAYKNLESACGKDVK